jgi:cytochrome bd ubiquinol oxidase subunit II
MALQILWFVLWGLLWAVYFVLDGFDFGASMLRIFLSRDEADLRVIHRSMGPVWDGNEVWLITAGGATFAAFPNMYASMFSFLYLPMLLILFSLILRGVAIELRPKHDGERWRKVWDTILAVSSFTAPLVLGLGFGNIFQGLAIDASGYRGTFWGLFNPYGLLTAVLFIVLFLQHGALWIAFRAEGELADRARSLAGTLWVIVLVVAVCFLVSTAFATRLYDNFVANPVWMVAPLAAVAALVATRVLMAKGGMAPFLASAAVILLVVATGIIGLFPNLLPSRIDPAASLTIYNSSSGPYTLKVMTIVALIFVPIVVVYQLLVYRFFGGKISRQSVTTDATGGY